MSNYWAYTWYLFEYLEESIMQAIVGQLKVCKFLITGIR
ncbi:hypothetical protein T08_10142 [Trichinella sp. T8]|uniref:Uncharacterized protein n=1 Tax=Trichinella murrelli TaxID=144512 RepID=A0A0V0SYD2_9BILA|nr:hypothetical protein T05_312 [Trichinella murrelli]KRZ64928.1 hypothetical protein T08_10142 [Trichinella sp. T8]